MEPLLQIIAKMKELFLSGNPQITLYPDTNYQKHIPRHKEWSWPIKQNGDEAVWYRKHKDSAGYCRYHRRTLNQDMIRRKECTEKNCNHLFVRPANGFWKDKIGKDLLNKMLNPRRSTK